MSNICFIKMQGAGNDFIMIDNRVAEFGDDQKSAMAARLCKRAVAVGADGMIFLEDDSEYDARWDFYNADGSSAEMCGNGARCFALFAKKLGLVEKYFTFRTVAGTIKAEVIGDDRAKIHLTDAPEMEIIEDLDIDGVNTKVYSINTGVPHVVVPVDNIEDVDILKYGAGIRYHERFAPAGTNVNFIALDGDGISIRTYERGVEAETLACGTGSVAAAIVAGDAYGLKSPVRVLTRSGDCLEISYSQSGSGYCDLCLEGPAMEVYRAEITE